MQSDWAGYLLQRIAIHILVSLPMTCNLRKQVCIIVLGDYFTKWGEAYPTVNKEANSVADLSYPGWD